MCQRNPWKKWSPTSLWTWHWECFVNYINGKDHEEGNEGERESILLVLRYLLVIEHGSFLLASPVGCRLSCVMPIWSRVFHQKEGDGAGQWQCIEPQHGFLWSFLEKVIGISRKWVQMVDLGNHSSLELLCTHLWHSCASFCPEPSHRLFPLAEHFSPCSPLTKLIHIFHFPQGSLSQLPE